MNTSTPTLSVVIVNWNGREPLRVCLESLCRHEKTYRFFAGKFDGIRYS